MDLLRVAGEVGKASSVQRTSPFGLARNVEGTPGDGME
jgi:hypothetical protein